MPESDNKAAVATEVSLVLAATFWGLNFAATKYAAATIPPLSCSPGPAVARASAVGLG